MKFAVLGGTHGNEPVGIKAIEALQGRLYQHQFETFLANPLAYERGLRFIDSDLNRAFGSDNSALGYEAKRSAELKQQIEGKFDFLLDLHTTTSSMGLTVILTKLDELSLKAACYLKKLNPELQIIVSGRAGSECPYTGAMAPSCLTLEVGPVANNVVNANLVRATFQMTERLLNYDFNDEFDYGKIECFRTIGTETYPAEGEWMVHPNIEGHDFKLLKKGEPLFVNIDGETLPYEGEDVYPLFVNEAAYQRNRTAMECAIKTTLDPEKILLNLKVRK